ncbi:DUF551 domain-containing protein [Acinetobacter ursingii]|uniref:DUF551 domain-containing protein n=1 Tax=Acinetobacter ursingii TaxID=108980 RepID=A0AA46PHD0_9GAMM|nr:DUF551 domain-containing protein [Acinetobacter ursingii]UYF76936.1 DUF551 domain-containing protein [Acinetobacter ursingii]
MVDLEKERKAFEEQWRLLGGHLLYVEWSTDNMYSLSPAAKVLNKNDQISLFNTINTAWGLWVVQAKQNKTVIDSLKAENIELQKKYQHADTQLSDIDGHYTLLKKEVEALKAKLEQSKKVWISVDFMLPDEGEKVLLAIGDEQTVAEKCRVFGFIDSIDREALRTDLITHWMSLPEPPSKEAQGDGDE